MMENDAISRSAVLEILSNEFDTAAEERAEADNEKDRAFNAGEINCARRSTRKVKDLPALDVAPVVRCKDCIHNEGLSSGTGWCKDDIVCNYHMSDGYADDDFCSHGARMDGEAE